MNARVEAEVLEAQDVNEVMRNLDSALETHGCGQTFAMLAAVLQARADQHPRRERGALLYLAGECSGLAFSDASLSEDCA